MPTPRRRYQSLTFPAIVRAVATATGKGLLGLSL
jgi:hypothetical protein